MFKIFYLLLIYKKNYFLYLLFKYNIIMEIKFYTLADPRDPNNIRYIGKTKQKLARRYDQHISSAKRAFCGKGRKNHTTN